MPIFRACVAIDNKVYCYDPTTNQTVEVKMEVMRDTVVPPEIVKQVVMKQFNLVEPSKKD